MNLEITLKPSGPYFLGNNRSPIYDDITQQRVPYFLTSNRMPTQTALFGITRYIGIRNPQADYQLGRNAEYIGSESFSLTNDNSNFGKLKGISPLIIVDLEGKHYIPAPRNHQAVTDFSGKKKTAEFKPYTDFITAETLDGERWTLPKSEFSVKNYDEAKLLCVETGELIGDIFDTQIRVGINRQQKKKQSNTDQNGFFKKEYTIMQPEYAFVYYVELADDAFGSEYGFTKNGQTTVLVGQSKTPFAAEWRTVSKPYAYTNRDRFICCFPHHLYAYAASDIYFEGSIKELKKYCMLALADIRDSREFTTNYAADVTMRRRYTKGKTVLRFMKAGSVFVFKDVNQQAAFKRLLEESSHFAHGKIAGLNQIYYIGTEEMK